MKHVRMTLGLVPALAAILLAAPAAFGEEAAMAARAQLRQFHESWVASGRPGSSTAPAVPGFGSDSFEFVNLHSYEFQGNTSSDLIVDDGNGYRYFGAPGVPYMAAPVRLPSGVAIDGLAISSCSANAGELVVALFDNGAGGAGGAGGTLIGHPILSFEGCSFTGSEFFPYTYARSSDHPLYVVVFFAGSAFDGSTKFNTVSVAYHRQVSPASAQATFGDVPTLDFGFQHIEALAASGITGGCGGGDYCPDSPVTRRQMAIFIAKALGLHWTD
jgi:S-layer homology domain